jgi:hypothetical protein
MKIHWTLKCTAFIASVISLSWFFAGWRQADWYLLTGGAAGTLSLLLLQSYWIYFEEKARGRLSRRFELFEKIDRYLSAPKDRKKEKGART